jgi:hypothetical protein
MATKNLFADGLHQDRSGDEMNEPAKPTGSLLPRAVRTRMTRGRLCDIDLIQYAAHCENCRIRKVGLSKGPNLLHKWLMRSSRFAWQILSLLKLQHCKLALSNTDEKFGKQISRYFSQLLGSGALDPGLQRLGNVVQ